MMKENQDISIQFAKYFAGEMNTEEERDFINTIEKDKKMQKDLKEMKNTWDRFSSYETNKFSNTGKAWQKLLARLDEEGLIEDIPPRTRSLSPVLLRIAASIILFLAISVPAYFIITGKMMPDSDINSFNAEINTTSYDLPDGSRVLLKKGSELSIQKGFEKQRTVVLNGEAFFDIMKDPSHPFSVSTKNSLVTVLGTSFNVKANKRSDVTEVFVETGKVSIQTSKKQDKIILNPGEFGRIRREKIEKAEIPDANYLAWKTREFVFVNEKLENVFNTLEDAYQVEIERNVNDLEELRLTSSYNKQSIDAIMKTIGTAFDLTVTEKENKYVVKNN